MEIPTNETEVKILGWTYTIVGVIVALVLIGAAYLGNQSRITHEQENIKSNTIPCSQK
ncbi:MAG: hypothetical protein WC774_03795 [Candidatus Gracilibacteria bacterium]